MRMLKCISGNIRKDMRGMKKIVLNTGGVAWDDLFMCKEKKLMHHYGRVIWFKLSEWKEVEEGLKSR